MELIAMILVGCGLGRLFTNAVDRIEEYANKESR